MKQTNFKEKIEIPADVEFSLGGRIISLKGSKGEVLKEFKMQGFDFNKEGNSLLISCAKYRSRDNEKFFTIKAHIKNMINGVNEGYTYKLKVCSSHFPMNVSISGNKLSVKNLLGEKVPRELKIKDGVKATLNGDIIEITGVDKERVSQVAADIEILTRVSNRDRRIFQDGIYIIDKNGKSYV
jgi:large subunit ribosomal protein L6